MTPNFVEYNNTDILMDSLALTVTEELKKFLDEKELVTLSLPGGSTPKPLFDRLSMKKLDWQRIVVIPNDERFVPETSMLSNCGLIRKTLLKNFANGAHLLSFFKPNLSAEDLSKVIGDEIKNFLPIDICIIGMGVDMHIASIFPDADKLNEALDLTTLQTILPIKAPSINETRLTLTAKVLRESTKLHLLLTGKEKRRALEFALKSKVSWAIAPVRSILYDRNEVNIHYAN